MKRKLLNFIVLSLLCLSSAFAQNITIKGKVTGKGDGLPIPGVSVKVKGKTTGAQTDGNGSYAVGPVTPTDVIVFSAIGYTTTEQTVGSKTVINVLLGEDAQSLSEVVINVAYGTAKKEAITGSVAQIGKKDLELRPLTNINSAISGASAGVMSSAGSGQPGASGSIRIRGFGSINASNVPLYVVDGAPYDGDLANLNVNDIQNISILKDASASALYGSRAANGVVIVTTIKGRKGNDQLGVNITQGVSSRGISEYDRVDAAQYYPLAWQAYKNNLQYPQSGKPLSDADARAKATASIKGALGYNPFNVADNAIVGVDGLLNPNAQLLYNDFDWAEPLRRVGKRTDANINYSGASEKSDYFLSLGYLDDKGYVERSDYNRITGRASINANPLTWFKTGLNVSGNLSKSNRASGQNVGTQGTTGSTGYNNIFYFARNMGPIYPVYMHDTSGAFILDKNGDRIFDQGANRPSGASSGRHVVQETLLNQDLAKTNMVSARAFGEISFLKDFKFTQKLNIDITNYNATSYENKLIGDGAPAGRAANSNSTTSSFTANQILNYNKAVGKNNFDFLAGHETYQYDYSYMTGSRNGQVLDGNTELINFTTTSELNAYKNIYHLESYFTQLNYNYDGKYFVNGSFRKDGSSKFGPKPRWGNFFSLGASWLITAEEFMKSTPWVNYLKLRTSYGSVGNDNLLDVDGNTIYYNYKSYYNLNYNNVKDGGLVLNTLETPALKWETNYSTDIALEYGLFNNRLRGTFEVFDRRSSNLLFNVPLPVSNGVGTIARNIGSMNNKGIEIEIGGDIIKNQNFKWDANINFTAVKNRMTKLPPESPTIVDGTKKLEVGHSRYDFWLKKWAGVDPADGVSLYVRDKSIKSNPAENRTIDGQDYTINPTNAEFGYAGTAIPKYAGSITNTFSYKAFQFSFIMNYQVGGKVYDSAYAGLMTYSRYGGALHTDALNAWKNPGDITDVPRLDVGQSGFNNAASDRWLISASYLSFRSATFSYNLPKALIAKADLKSARVYLGGENLFLLSKRKGLDPSYSYNGTTSAGYSPTRTVTVGLNVAF
ncbi:SusC/RagA family TonB-linked outer membrane protein [Pedobacter cryoconitis]|uniref:TonB-linked SusC/RagA family outer membrane protein n=1 Tax=Pedobacter cryoconitis TaxID=188932 RepID=A0A327T8S9_9SPHI|nr:SusC/RagA family TonB-linked outer membrane protein [Pedobacter cryoconitis]RAJ34197.1 TonB-linked SusC/RagA family outer membrane protein [Pedobacter cryoconitis]